MIRTDRFFGNKFSSDKIIPMRLLTFTRFVIAALSALDNDFFTAIITKLTTSADALDAMLSNVDVGMIDQKGSTSAVKDFMKAFGRFMKEQEVNIASALGGRENESYKAFYPLIVSEYTKATQKRMTVLTARVQKAAEMYEAGLPPTLSAQLKAFAPTFKILAKGQKEQITTVNNDRIGRTEVYVKLQFQLTAAMHLVGAEYTEDEAFCNAKFPLYMLYAPGRSNKLEREGELAAGESKELLNCSLTNRVNVTIRNTGTNANILVWLAALPTDAAPATAIVLKPGESKIIKATRLGDIAKNTFLMIANNSSINSAEYEVEISGLKKGSIANDK